MYKFHVPAMNCEGCARAITRSIHSRDAEAHVTPFPAIHRLDVRTRLSKEELLAAIEEAGYAEGLEEK